MLVFKKMIGNLSMQGDEASFNRVGIEVQTLVSILVMIGNSMVMYQLDRVMEMFYKLKPFTFLGTKVLAIAYDPLEGEVAT